MGDQNGSQWEHGRTAISTCCSLDRLTGHEYAEQVVSPRFPEIMSANNDFHAQTTDTWDGDWAEDSLLLSERALRRLNVSAPTWLNQAYYQQRIVGMSTDTSTHRGA